ncbi:hypothetical protein chiPu_0007872 [Chiloscyllium punctatum]|uniref:B30.2/SPRY domain-containing protein n=1 Tax=Chiloscyllium punctatum TaxID=137246 RepID=A0A401SGG3_CHIPU|nr:hypothetical protein [Chiloscyllium punctatum]
MDLKGFQQHGHSSWRLRLCFVFAVEVLLDEYTADPRFSLSKDRSSIRWDRAAGQGGPHLWKKHSDTWSVWGKEGYTSGRKYWLVSVSPNTVWSVGLARQHVSLGQWKRPSPQEGYWTVMLWNFKPGGQQVRTLGNLIVVVQLSKVGIYLNYEEGRVSFYNPEDSSHLYTYKTILTGRIFPVFRLWVGSFQQATLIIL